jgi:hypothetical protein
MKDAWRRLEEAYGRKIPDRIRSSIENLTVNYIWLAMMEHIADPSSSARKIISSAHKSAETLLSNLEDIQNCKTDAHMFVGHLVRRQLAPKLLSKKLGRERFSGKMFIRRPLRDDLGEIIRVLGALSSALTGAGEEQQLNADSQREGQSWAGWIRNLKSVLKEAGLPVGAHKDNRSASPSAFVKFLSALQEELPQIKGVRRFADDLSLAEAIHRIDAKH